MTLKVDIEDINQIEQAVKQLKIKHNHLAHFEKEYYS
jgi:transposase